ncbi:MAG: Nramp family divalent metal transporter [Bacteroidia bacterium]|nr:Nramp family divalent metal transporter [Bacteroidia bacterium]MDW8235595.1 Nramp family divalent metal transporter [Bacteroidia bacterium]
MQRWIGPAALVAVGYMDPGNWATGIEAGSGYGYKLAWVILLSSAAAILLQILAARLGIYGKKDLIGLGYRYFGPKGGKALAITAFVAVIATDLAEVLGFALALRMLFGLPMEIGALLAVVETVIVLSITARRPLLLESLVGTLTLGVVGIFAYELLRLRPDPQAILRGFLPDLHLLSEGEALYLALGLIGATIMPHNLYLHSAWIRQHKLAPRQIIWDTALHLTIAFFVNISLLLVAASLRHVPSAESRWGIQEAYLLFEPVVGKAAQIAFAFALLISGYNATLTSTLTGQIVLEYLIPQRIPTFWRGILVRSLSLIPALLALWLLGESYTSTLLVLSQVILSLQLPFVLLPMIYFLRHLPEAALHPIATHLTYVISLGIVGLNMYLLFAH